MELNLHILREDLSSWNLEGHLSHGPEQLTCTHPLLFVPGVSFFAGPVYVAQAKDLPSRPPGIAPVNIICTGMPPACYLEAPINILYTVGEEANYLDLFSACMEAFRRYGAWCHKLERIVEQHGSARELGLASLPLFGNPIDLWSPGFRNIFYVRGAIDEESGVLGSSQEAFEHSLARFRDDQFIPLEDIRVLASDDNFVQVADADAPVLYENCDDFPCRSLIYAVKRDAAAIGYLIIDEVNHLISDRDRALAVILGSYVARLPSLAGEQSATLLDEVLASLMRHVPVDDDYLEDALEAIGWSPDDELAVCAIATDTGDLHRASRTIARVLGTHPEVHDIRPVPAEDGLAFLVNLTRQGGGLDATIAPMLSNGMGHVRSIGCSEPFTNLLNTPAFAEQARAALQMGTAHGELAAQSKGAVPITHYADVYARDMVRRCSEGRPLEALVPAGLRRLMRSDHENGTSLTELLGLYLDHNLSIAQTSRLAYLHRNTCLARLKRAEQIVGADLEDPDTVLGLRIAFGILRSRHLTGTSKGSAPAGLAPSSPDGCPPH